MRDAGGRATMGSLHAQSDYIRERTMNPVSGAARVAAVAVAISVTFSIVWVMANLGYPGNADVNTQLAATTHTRASQ
jgi:hypothetical protein